MLILPDWSSRTPQVGYGSNDVLAVPPLQVSETALRGGLAGNLEKETLEVIRRLDCRILLLMAKRGSHLDSETAYPMHIESCRLGLVRQEEPC